MNKQPNEKNLHIEENISPEEKASHLIIKTLLAIIVTLTVGLFCYSLFCGHIKGEAYFGSFETFSLNDNWSMFDTENSSDETITLPLSTMEKEGKYVVLTNKLPDSIQNGMSICVRSSMQDIIVRIDGQERGSYTSAGFEHMSEKLPSSFLVIDLNDEDASKVIEIDITSKKSGIGNYNAVSYGFGDNIWFSIIEQNIVITFISVFVTLIGVVAFFTYLQMKKKIPNMKSLKYISGMMIVDGMWILSESELRQIIFSAPSYSSIYSYILVSIIAALTVLYFNEVQNKHYQRWYYAICGVIVCQVIINTVLHFSGIVQYYDTLIISHLWSVVAILISIITIIVDIRKKQIRNYGIIASGMVGLIICAIIELISFYFSSQSKIGAYLGIGLVILLISTITQIFSDAITNVEKRRVDVEKRNRMTILTITKAIDAKDKYTGSHSERVGKYARILCEAVAEKYGFDNDDFARIQYIGNLHDIGKIAVPDNILNKQDKLNDKEFSLMKSHTTLGFKIIENMETVEGLGDGVLYHHERYDGKGYPEGLKGEEIPIFARILCIVDCYDAMTSNRVYRKRLSEDEARAEIKRCAGTQFDPYLAAKFLELIDNGVIHPLMWDKE